MSHSVDNIDYILEAEFFNKNMTETRIIGELRCSAEMSNNSRKMISLKQKHTEQNRLIKNMIFKLYDLKLVK